MKKLTFAMVLSSVLTFGSLNVAYSKECLVAGEKAHELVNDATSIVYVGGGENPISSEAWDTYKPKKPYRKNEDRNLTFDDSCLFRSPAASSSCKGDNCFKHITTSDGYTWIELAIAKCADCLPGGKACSISGVKKKQIRVNVIHKCQDLTWSAGRIYEMTDPHGNQYVMHATEALSPTKKVKLPKGWKITTRKLSEPLTIEPKGESCQYTLLRDNLNQGYHQYTFVNEDDLNNDLINCAKYR